jgi:hypothetical protein
MVVMAVLMEIRVNMGNMGHMELMVHMVVMEDTVGMEVIIMDLWTLIKFVRII